MYGQFLFGILGGHYFMYVGTGGGVFGVFFYVGEQCGIDVADLVLCC